MKCPNCGEINPEGAKFCRDCGFKLENQAHNAIVIDDNKDDSKSSDWWMCCVCLVFIFIIFALFSVF